MDKSEIRLKNLEKWFEGQSIPKKDRSFISQKVQPLAKEPQDVLSKIMVCHLFILIQILN